MGTSMYNEISHNKTKSYLLLALFAVFTVVVAYAASYKLFGGSYFAMSLIGSLIYILVSYYGASKFALGINNVKIIEKRDNPRLYRIVENLAITDGLPMPKVGIMDDAALNAFATGRNPQNSYVVATTGLLDALTDRELTGVFAHEMGHVKNYDIRVSMIAMAMSGLIGALADWIRYSMWFGGGGDDDNNNSSLNILAIVFSLLGPFIAMMIKLAISRKREYLADATGSLTTRDPDALASALQKIAEYGSVTRKDSSTTAHLFFANPLSRKSIMNSFSTHPPIEDRIKKLKGMHL